MESTLGKRIAANRKRLGMTQEQLAEKLGITAQAVSKWENDQSCPDINILSTLADIFGISTDILLGHRQMPATQENGSNQSKEQGNPSEETGKHSKGFHVNIDLEETKKGKLFIFAGASLFLVVGILYLLSRFLNWDCNLWDIIWPSALLVFGVFGLISKVTLFWMACAGVGAFFLVNNIVPLPIELDKGILWAIIIIICGVALLLDALRKKRKVKLNNHDQVPFHSYAVDDGILDCSNSFGEEHQLVTTELLKGGKITNSFGEYSVNLSGVDAVADNCTIEASCSFGEMKLLVPSRYRVTHNSSTSFASYEVVGNPDDVTDGQIILNANVSFGEITVLYI